MTRGPRCESLRRDAGALRARELPAHAAEAHREHLATCGACRTWYDAWCALLALPNEADEETLDDAFDTERSDALFARIEAALDADPSQTDPLPAAPVAPSVPIDADDASASPRARRPSPLPRILLAAAGLLVALGSGWWLGSSRGSTERDLDASADPPGARNAVARTLATTGTRHAIDAGLVLVTSEDARWRIDATRTIYLDAGDLLAEVLPSPAGPPRIIADGSEVAITGTIVGVSRHDASTTVRVYEGEVVVSRGEETLVVPAGWSLSHDDTMTRIESNEMRSIDALFGIEAHRAITQRATNTEQARVEAPSAPADSPDPMAPSEPPLAEPSPSPEPASDADAPSTPGTSATPPDASVAAALAGRRPSSSAPALRHGPPPQAPSTLTRTRHEPEGATADPGGRGPAPAATGGSRTNAEAAETEAAGGTANDENTVAALAGANASASDALRGLQSRAEQALAARRFAEAAMHWEDLVAQARPGDAARTSALLELVRLYEGPLRQPVRAERAMRRFVDEGRSDPAWPLVRARWCEGAAGRVSLECAADRP